MDTLSPFSHLPDAWAAARFDYFPPRLQGAVRREWLRLRNRSLRGEERRVGVLDDGRQAQANDWLRQLVGQFPAQALELGASEEALVEFAVDKAHEGERLRMRGACLATLGAFCTDHGLSLPEGDGEDAIARRVGCSLWWRRNLRKVNARLAETLSISLGLVHRQRGLYCSDDAVNRRATQRRRNRALLEALVAINELGEQFSLAELADKGMANPAIKRAELMVRIAGFEYIAQALDLAGEFISLTAPSRYHPRHAKTGHRNARYQPGLTPTDTRNYLGQVWSRITAALARAGIKIFGFRVAEPHHDGTPHFHGLFFLRPDEVPAFRRIVARYAVREDRGELGLSYAQTHAQALETAREQRAAGQTGRLADLATAIGWETAFWERPPRGVWQAIKARADFKAIDWSRGTAAGYIAKYIAKNIDGFKTTGESIGQDYEAQGAAPLADGEAQRDDASDACHTARRVDAWASTWGIRQFQQVGGPPVGVWRELRRWDYMQQDAEDVLMRAAAAADAGHWGRFVEVMGGWEAKRKDMTLTLAKEQRQPHNRYGEAAQPTTFGVVEKDSGQLAVSRMHEWKVCHGRAAPAWTRVNNSTELAPRHAGPVIREASSEERRAWDEAIADDTRRRAIQPLDEGFLPPAQLEQRQARLRTARQRMEEQQHRISRFAAMADAWVAQAEEAAQRGRVHSRQKVEARRLRERFAQLERPGIEVINMARPAPAPARPAQPRHAPALSVAAQLSAAIAAADQWLTKVDSNPAGVFGGR